MVHNPVLMLHVGDKGNSMIYCCLTWIMELVVLLKDVIIISYLPPLMGD